MEDRPRDGSRHRRGGVLVTGTGAAAGPPDIAVLDLGAEVRAATAGAALDAVSLAVAAMREALVAAGLVERDLATAALTLTPYYDDFPVVAGYQASLALKARSRSVEAVGALVVAAASAAGDAARIRGIAFEHSDPRGLETSARELAWADARARAEQLAALAGRPLGEPVSIEEGVAHPGRPPGPVMRAMASADLPVDAGESSVCVQLAVRWSFA